MDSSGVPVPDTSNVGNNPTLFEVLGVEPTGPVNYKPDEVINPGEAAGMKAEEEAQRVAEGLAYEMNQAKQKGRYVNYVNPGAMRPPKPDGPPPPDTPPPPSGPEPTSVPQPVSPDMELNQLPGNPEFAPTEHVVASVGNEEEPMSGGAGSKRRRSEKRRSEKRRSKRRRSEKRQPKRRLSKKRRSERRQSKRRRSKKPIRKHRTQRKKNNV